MALDKKTIQLLENKMTQSIAKLRKVTEKEINKLMKRAEEAQDEDRRKVFFQRGIALARKTEQAVAEMEVQMAAIKNPWRATPTGKKASPKKKR